MNISSINTSSELLSQLEKTQRKETPSSSDFAAKIMAISDVNKDSVLDISEFNISEELFTLMDSDASDTLSSDELTESIFSKQNELKYNTSTPEEFGEFLSQLGLQVPPKPPTEMPDVANIASNIFDSKDTNDDNLLSIEELGISSELFSSLDNNEDKQLTQEELEEKLTLMFEGLNNGDITFSEFEETMSALGAIPPSQSGGQENSSSQTGGTEEEFEAADTNEDGTVSVSEYAAYYGVDEDYTSEKKEQYSMNLVSTLIDSLEDNDDINLSEFKDIMKMVNNEVQKPKIASELNQYLTNL